MAITIQDQQVLQAILGVEQLPEDVVQEAELRTKLYHGAGACSGPLGPLAMIDLVRFLGHRPKKAEPKVEGVIWRNLTTDGSVKVVAGPFFGSMQEGVFLGIMPDGKLAIKINVDGMVRECRQQMVTLASEGHVDYKEPAPPVADLIQEPIDTQDEEIPEFAWESVSKDAPVWVSQGDDKDPLTGSFVKVLKDGKLSVKIEGEDKARAFEKETVLYAG